MLFHRLAAGKDKEGILKLARSGQIVESPEDLLRDPFVLEFLKMPEPAHWHEEHLETRLINQLQAFLLELGTKKSNCATRRSTNYLPPVQHIVGQAPSRKAIFDQGL